eukprot:6046806-Lingulodinium_polyedra.AAC.1
MELDGTPRAGSDGAQSLAYTVDWEQLQKSLGEHLEAAGVAKQQAADVAKAAVLLNTKRPPGSPASDDAWTAGRPELGRSGRRGGQSLGSP